MASIVAGLLITLSLLLSFGTLHGVPLAACSGVTGLKDYIGTDCDPHLCHDDAKTEAADSPPKLMYPGPYCSCQPCPSVPNDSSGTFDKQLYSCLVKLKYCPTLDPINGATETQQPLAGSKISSLNLKSPEGNNGDGGDSGGSSSESSGPSTIRTTGEAETAETGASPSDKWIGLAIGLGVLVIGIAGLGIWIWFEVKQRNRCTAKERPKEEQNFIESEDGNERETEQQQQQQQEPSEAEPHGVRVTSSAQIEHASFS